MGVHGHYRTMLLGWLEALGFEVFG
uniref:Uncharacterized protein n=1 Tax=Arundo donax TaxID=35708 RepID=A0A0A9BXJ1_ARUDO